MMAKLRKLATLLLSISLLGRAQALAAPGASAAGLLDAGTVQSADIGTAQLADIEMAQSADIGAAQAADAGMAQSAPVRAEAGIIEVLSGFVDPKGKFWQMKSGSGFLIANKESDTYIITNCSSVSNTPSKIKKYCKKHSINTENMQMTNTIRVVIKGDVTAEAEVVMKSAEKDYCVLSAANVVSQKESLKLGDSTGAAVNDLVYAYGFPKQAKDSTVEYSEMDVRSMQGAVIQTETYLDDNVYMAHSAPVMQGMEGGPLMDADGYVIGLNCKQSPEDDTGVAYALPINEIISVLDNFSIYYGSRAIDEAKIQLNAAYQECAGIQEAGGYKKASMEALEQALESAKEMLGEEEPAAAELIAASQTLYTARDGLVPKTETITVMVIVTGILDVLLFIWMLVLAVKNAQEKKAQLQRVRPGAQGAGYARAPGNAASLDQQLSQRTEYIGQGAGMPRPQNAGPRPQMPQNADYFRRPVAPPAGRRLRIVRQKTGQSVVLNKNQFIIGKSQTQADFSIADNQTISRKHAVLFEDNGGWYVDDLNSLNGTCVNGKKVVPGQAVRLQSGDKLTLSDEAFLVQD